MQNVQAELESKLTAATDRLARDDREGFERVLEQHMHAMTREIEQLIEMHDRYGDTLQKSYLYKALAALRDGLSWFDWSRKRRAEKAAAEQPAASIDIADPEFAR